ncbi:hypothetical protein ILUMI_13344 [Ignelater luminosus]|uniref:Uncharacterized protein n=1 Tax=Ignelater luminosus TaxID=2038154 RepID=A0A8K0GB00_IGNLU|nr:hypothetical protein ILUMI_13344 [Ignelater luminosus]
MVRTQVLVIFTFCVLAGVNSEDVIYRGTSKDGTYNEIRHSQGPGGQTKVVTTFSSRVLGGNGRKGPVLANRMFGLEPFGLSQLPGPGFPSPQNIFNSALPQGPFPYNPPAPFQPFGPPVGSPFQQHPLGANPISQVFGSGLEAAPAIPGIPSFGPQLPVI